MHKDIFISQTVMLIILHWLYVYLVYLHQCNNTIYTHFHIFFYILTSSCLTSSANLVTFYLVGYSYVFLVFFDGLYMLCPQPETWRTRDNIKSEIYLLTSPIKILDTVGKTIHNIKINVSD